MNIATSLPNNPQDFVWSSHQGMGADALESVKKLSASALAAAEIRDHSGGRYFAHWRHVALGQVDVNAIEVAPQQVIRTQAMVSRCPDSSYYLMLFRRGQAQLQHYHRDVAAGHSSLIIIDNQEPFDLLLPDGGSCLIARLSAEWLRRWLPQPRMHVAQPVAGDHGWGAPLAALLTTIADLGLEQAPLSRAEMADQIGTLLAMAFRDPPTLPTTRQCTWYFKLSKLVATRYDEPDLSPSRIAALAGISVRRLHGVFAAAGTTFSTLLMDTRLRHATRMLKDGRYAGYSIGEIAARCGFADPSYFARRFRRQFGVQPHSFRHH